MADRRLIVMPATVLAGRLLLAHRGGFRDAIAGWPDCSAVVRVEECRDPRSVALNAFYWDQVVPPVVEATGYTTADAHELLKAGHLSRRLHALRGGPVCWRCADVIGGSTRPLSSGELWRYIQDIQIGAAERLGVVIPDPDGTGTGRGLVR